MSAPLGTGLALVGALEARVSGRLPAGVGGISIDTRTLEPGELFFAIKGENSDGHDYVRAAFERGAAACVIDEAHADALIGSGACFIVHDTFAALQRRGRASRARTSARVVAVTGSGGKTTTKEALRHVLSHAGVTHASAASYNNHWGVPLTLARMPRETHFGVIEIGMNHAGEITPLTAMAKPHVAIITTVAPVHLEFFDSVEAIADAKAEIFSGLVPGGVAILNADNPHYQRLDSAARAAGAGHIATFGADSHADARLIALETDETHAIVTARVAGREVTYRLGAPGRHVAMNSLAVLLTAQAFGLDLDEAANSLATFEVPAGRGRRFVLRAKDGPFTLLDESYNANPASVGAALALVGGLKAERRIAVLGDMLELGHLGPSLHAALAEDVSTHHIDLVFAAGPLMRNLFNALPQDRRGGL